MSCTEYRVRSTPPFYVQYSHASGFLAWRMSAARGKVQVLTDKSISYSTCIHQLHAHLETERWAGTKLIKAPKVR